MIRKLPLLLVVAVLFCPSIYAENEPDSQPVPELVRAHVEGMEITKPALLEMFKLVECPDLWDTLDGSKEALAPRDIENLILELQEFNTSLRAAAQRVEPFIALENESLKTAAGSIFGTYQKFIEDNEAAISRLQSLMENPGSEEELHKAEFEVEDSIGLFTSGLSSASISVEDAIKTNYPDQGLNGYPKEDKEEIVKRLETIFGQNPGADGKLEISLAEGVHFRNAVVFLIDALEERKPEAVAKQAAK